MAEIQSALDIIDAAVDGKCACNCGAKLDPNGDSMWFASDACQRAYMSRQATNPAEVQNRDDAAVVIEGADHIRVLPGEDVETVIRRAYLDMAPAEHAPRPRRDTSGRYLTAGSWLDSAFDQDHVHISLHTNPPEPTAPERSDGQFAYASGGIVEPGQFYRVGESDRFCHPLRRLTPGPLRSLADRADWRDYWPHEADEGALSNFEWSDIASTVNVPPDQVGRGIISAASTAPSEPTNAYESLVNLRRWIEANPTVGGRIDPASVADWAEDQGLHLDPWQRQMLDAVYSPQPRLFGARRDSIQVGDFEIPVQYSPSVREGSVMVVNTGWLQDHLRRMRVTDVAELSSEYDFMQDRYRIRYGMRVVAEVTGEMLEQAGATLRHPAPVVRTPDVLVIFDEAGGFFARIRRRGRGWTAPRNNPKLSHMWRLYRRKSLARRRRNR